jgi:DNA-binding CsgD family transcriptional regulator
VDGPPTDRGRDAEFGAVRRLLAGGTGADAVLLTSPPGMGKSWVWEHGVELGRRTPVRVAASVCAAAETAMPYAGLADLIEPMADELGAQLPEPQQYALDVVLGRVPAVEPRQVTVRAVAAAVAGVLRLALRSGPLLLALDDYQWLDVESDQVLSYAARRLGDHPLRLLATARDPSALSPGDDVLRPDRAPSDVASGLPDAFPHCARIALGPLSPAAARHMLLERRGLVVTLEEARGLVERTGGNPFWLLEFTRDGHDPVGRPTPPTLPVVIRHRLDRLPPGVVSTATLVAALGRPLPAAVHTALPETPSAEIEDALDAAIDADLLTFTAGRLTPAHPLVGAALLASTPPFRRRRLHELAADLADAAESRAHHLLQAHAIPAPASGPADGPGAAVDDTLLRALDAASASAARRGGPVLAARFAERALALLDEGAPGEHPERVARLVAVGEMRLGIADYAQARALVERLDLRAVEDDLFARAALVLCDCVLRLEGPAAALGVLATLEEGASDRSESARAALVILRANPYLSGPEWARWAEQAVVATDAPAIPAHLRRRALSRVVLARLFTARGNAGDLAADVVSRIEALDAESGPVPAAEDSRFLRALCLYCDDRLVAARAALDEVGRSFSDAGDDFGVAIAGSENAMAMLALGDVDAADEELDRVVDRADLHLPEVTGVASARGLVHLARGDTDRVEALIADEATTPLERDHLAGMLALSRGEPERAVEPLEAYLAMSSGIAMVDPLMLWHVHPLLAAAHLSLGRTERAEEILEHLDAVATRTSRPVTRGQERRLRAQLALARDAPDPGAALTWAAEAVALHEDLPRPAELARSLDVLARAQEATGDTAAAGTRRRADEVRRAMTPSSAAGVGVARQLSAAELAVARLVAAGHSDRAAALELHLSVRTVQNHLSRAYRKLGVAGRAQLRDVLGAS